MTFHQPGPDPASIRRVPRGEPRPRRHAGLRELGPVVVVVAAALALTVPAAASSKASGEPWQAAPSAVIQAVTHVAPSVFDAVGLQSGVAAPVLLHGQPSLTFDGKPGIFYEASEPCPFCAAQRWAFVVALARFGSWSELGIAAVGDGRRRSRDPDIHLLAGDVFQPIRGIADQGALQ